MAVQVYLENICNPINVHYILFRGVIVDPGHDFFVEDHEVVDRTALPTEYNDDYWEKRYCLRVDRIPTFLHAYADTILRTGQWNY